MIYLLNLPHASQQVSVGWEFSTVIPLPQLLSSWGPANVRSPAWTSRPPIRRYQSIGWLGLLQNSHFRLCA
jgi:hypothetical protein